MISNASDQPEPIEARLDAALSALDMIRKHRDELAEIVSEAIVRTCPTTDDRVGFMLHVSADLLARARKAVDR